MQAVKPNVPLDMRPPGAIEMKIGKNQPEEYLVLPALGLPDGTVTFCFKPDVNDLLLLQNGVPVYITLLYFYQVAKVFCPVKVEVGPPDLRGHLNLLDVTGKPV